MTITAEMCHRFTLDATEFGAYARGAINVSGFHLFDDAAGAVLQTLQFEVVHIDPTCRLDLADACVFLSAQDQGVQFLAPAADAAANYVSYWHKQMAPDEQALWAPLAAGQGSDGADLAILGQSLPTDLDPDRGSGFLHYVGDTRPGDGWTVRVGIRHRTNAPLHGAAVNITVAVRPDWYPTTNGQQVQLP